MDLGGVTLSEMLEKDKYCMVSLPCGIAKQNRTKLTDTENTLVVTRGGGCRDGQNGQSDQNKINPEDGVYRQHGELIIPYDIFESC